MSCIFCQFLDGTAPASFVHRDDRCVAFMCLRPVNIGHVLIVPRTHAALLGGDTFDQTFGRQRPARERADLDRDGAAIAASLA